MLTILSDAPVATPALTALARQIDHFCADTSLHPAPAPVALDGTIYQTTDYELFHLLPENREIDPNHVRKLVALIGQRNLLHLKPLDVTAELGIIDGQHRWAAARELGVPVYYKVGEQLSEADITTLNIAQKNWKGEDYLHFWTVKGKPAYQALTAFRKAHPKLSFSNAKMLMTRHNHNLALVDFNAGRWESSDAEAAVAEQVAQLIERIADEVGFKNPHHTRFVAALHRCFVHVAGFEADHFMRKLNMQPRALRQQATDRQYLEMFQELYNYKTAQENRIRFF